MYEEIETVGNLEADNIDLIQSPEEVKEFCDSAGYDNEDDYDYAFIVWGKERTGDVQAVYGSYSVDLGATAYIMRQKTIIKKGFKSA